MKELKQFTVDQLKTRLDKFLAENCEGLSRSRIQHDIENGLVKVNDQVQSVSKFVVRIHDQIEYEVIAEEKPQPVNIPIKTLYNNHGLLILDKPAGLVVHPGAGFKGDSLAQALLYHFKDIHLVGEEGRNGIVHRLDKDTSGVMMVALTQDMYEYLKKAFLEKGIRKEYIALVKGKLENSHGIIESPLGKSKKDFRKYTTDKSDMHLEKPSKTEYWALETLQIPSSAKSSSEGPSLDFYTLIRVKLHTGRMHQIRIHFSSIGHPIIGDELYGRKAVMKLGLQRQFLHSSKLEVQLPDKTWVEMDSKLPGDLRAILKELDSKLINNI